MAMPYKPAFETAAQEAAAMLRTRADVVRKSAGRYTFSEPQVADNKLAVADEIDKAADWLEQQQDGEATS